MSDQKQEILMDGQPVSVSFNQEQIDVALARETINVQAVDGKIRFSLGEERFDFSSPLVLAAGTWPFGPNSNKVETVIEGVPTEVDRVAMPAYYRVVKWLFLISDEASDLAVTSEIKCIRKGETVYYIEYALLGDGGVITYDLDLETDGDRVKLMVTSHYPGVLTVRTMKLGIFT